MSISRLKAIYIIIKLAISFIPERLVSGKCNIFKRLTNNAKVK